MKIIDATPPKDFPSIVIVLDKEMAKSQPEKAFYIRVAQADGGVQHVDIEGAITPLDARKVSRKKGYEPTHWMEVRDLIPTRFY